MAFITGEHRSAYFADIRIPGHPISGKKCRHRLIISRSGGAAKCVWQHATYR